MKKITFKNEPSVETPLSAENLNNMQNNVEEEINKVDGELKKNIDTTNDVNERLKFIENNKIDVEVFVDSTIKNTTAEKWGIYKNSFVKTVTTKKLFENDPSAAKRFKVLENGIYKITYETNYTYDHISGVEVLLNNNKIKRILTTSKENSVVDFTFLDLKKDDFIDIYTYTDAVGPFAHKFTSVIFEKIGEYIPPAQ